MTKLKTPTETYQAIRQAYPKQNLGRHWDGTGTYLGSGIWADPKWANQPGAYEFLYQARTAHKPR